MISRTTASHPLPITQSPEPPGWPLIGQSLNLITDPLSYLVTQTERHGPIFQVQMGFKKYVVLAGEEANRLLAREDSHLFESHTLFGGFAEVAGTDVMMVAMDGPQHTHMRKLLRPGFSRSSINPHIATLIDLVRERLEIDNRGEPVPVLEMMRRLTVDQIGIVSANFKASDYYEDLLVYLNTMLNTEVLRLYPRAVRKLPRFQRAVKRINRLADEVMRWHEENPPHKDGRPRDLIDDVMAGCRPDGQPFTNKDLVNLVIGPFFAGMDTLASTMAFYLYAILKHPDVYAAAKAEVDTLFADGIPDPKAFRNLETLHAAAIETLRRYPVTPFTPRVVAKPFEFGGYTFPVGTEVMFAQTVTHFMPRYFPEPETFDISRFMGNTRAGKANVFTPFTVGTHSCLGAGLAEIQMLVSMAAFIHFVDFEPLPDDYEVTIFTQPLPNPGNRFTVNIRNWR